MVAFYVEGMTGRLESMTEPRLANNETALSYFNKGRR
jgi:hypothetical protein